MELHVINSNSKGNAYILEAENGEALLIECGVHFTEIKKALGFDLSRVVACIVTHEHGDHCKSVKDVMNAGINVWCSAGTHMEMGTDRHHRAKVCLAGKPFEVCSFRVTPFEIEHDVRDPYGYVIYHPECGNVLFLTDTYYCKYKFNGLNNIIIEANYCQEIIDQRLADGVNPKFLRDRILTSHMSIKTCKETLQAYDLSKVVNVVLIHLSDGNSHAVRFKKEVEEVTGKLVNIAQPGLSIPFNVKAI
jgi:phosphoribosyl 1,2-cyclic phosphodiesterase